jgi:hypothetical protein
MAIKGKGRARSGRRVVAASPRPQLFVRKPPIWKRRWLRLTALAVIVLAVAAGLWINVTGDHRSKFQARERAAVAAFSRQIFNAFPGDQSQIQPDVFVFYPSLTQDLDNLSKGKLSNSAAKKKADLITTSAGEAQTQVQAGNIKLISPTFTATTVPKAAAKGLTLNQLTDAQFLMGQAFGMYVQVGTIMKEAVAASGAQRTALIGEAKALYTQTGQVFDRGYRTLLLIRESLGIPFKFPSPGRAPPGG